MGTAARSRTACDLGVSVQGPRSRAPGQEALGRPLRKKNHSSPRPSSLDEPPTPPPSTGPTL